LIEGIKFDVGLNTQPYIGGLSKMRSANNQFENSLRKLGQVMTTVFSAVAIEEFVRRSTNAFLQFNKAMSNVSTMSTANISKMSSAVQRMSIEFGKDLVDASNALYNIVSSGYDGSQALDVLRASMKAATAGASDLMSSANAIIATMKSFGLETNDINKILDLQFTALKKGRMTYTELANAIGIFLPAAKSMGSSLEEALGTFAYLTQILSPDEAKTSLNAIYRSLSQNVDKLKDLGIVLYDSQGRFVGLSNVAQQVAKAIRSMSDEQKTAFFETMQMDVRAQRGFLLLAQNVDEYNKVLQEMTQSTGAATEAFEKQDKSLASLYQKFKTARESVMVSFGRVFSTIFAPFVENATNKLKKLNDALIEFAGKLKDPKQALDMLKQKFIDFFASLSPIAKGILAVVGAFLAVKFATLAWNLFVGAVNLGAKLLITVFTTLTKWPVLLAAGAFLLYTAWDNNWFKIRDITEKVWNKIEPIFTAMWDWIKNHVWDWVVTVGGNFWNWIKETWDKYKDSIKEFGKWLKDIGSKMVIWSATILGNLWGWIKDKAWPSIVQGAKDIWKWITEVASKTIEWTVDVLGNAWDWLKDSWNTIKAGAISFWNWLKGLTNKFIAWTITLLGNVWDWLTDKAWPSVVNAAQSFWNWIKGIASKAYEWSIDILGTAWDWLKDTWPKVTDTAKAFWKWLTGLANKTIKWGIDIVGKAWDWLSETWPKIGNTAKEFWKWISGLVSKSFEWSIDILGNVWDWLKKVWPSVSKTAESFWKWLKGITNKAIEWSIGIAGKVWDWLKNVWPNVSEAAKGFWNWLKGVTSKIVAWSLNALGNLWDILTGKKKVSFDDLWNKLKDFGKWIGDNAEKTLKWTINIGGDLMKLGASGIEWLAEKLKEFNVSIEETTQSLENLSQQGDLGTIADTLTPEQRNFITQSKRLGESIGKFAVEGFKATFNVVSLIQEGIKAAVTTITGSETAGEAISEIPIVFTAVWAGKAITNLINSLQKGAGMALLETGIWSMTIYLAFEISKEMAKEKIGLQAKDFVKAALVGAGFGVATGLLTKSTKAGAEAAALAFTVTLYIDIQFAQFTRDKQRVLEQYEQTMKSLSPAMQDVMRDTVLNKWDRFIIDTLGEEMWKKYMKTDQGPLIDIGYWLGLTILGGLKKFFVDTPIEFAKWIGSKIKKTWDNLVEKGKEIGNALIEGIKAVFSALNPLNLFKKPTQSQINEWIQSGGTSGAPVLGIPVSQQVGGFTPDIGVSQPAGIVHGGEWVAPAWMVKKYRRFFDWLEAIRKRGYREGGYTLTGGGRIQVGSETWWKLSWEQQLEVMVNDMYKTFSKLLSGLNNTLSSLFKSLGIEMPQSVQEYINKMKELIGAFDGIEGDFKSASDKILKEIDEAGKGIDDLGKAAGDAGKKLAQSSQIASSAMQALASHIEWLSYSQGGLHLDLGAGIGNFINILLGGLPQIFPALNWILNPFSALANFILDMLRPKPKTPEYGQEEETTVYGQTFVAGTAREVTYNFNVVFKENILLTEDENAQKTLFESFIRYVNEHGGVEVVFG